MTDHEQADQGAVETHGGWRRTTINPRWMVKFVIFFVIAFGIGLWGAFDAFVAYPARGQFDAEWKLRLYLEQAESSSRMFDANVVDPAAELDRLRNRPDTERTPLEVVRLEWLEALALVESLDAIAQENALAQAKQQAGEPFDDTETFFANPTGTLAALTTAHSTASTPKPLSQFDIPVQYLIMGAGLIVSLWIVFHVVKTRRVSYAYEPSTMTLELPDGRKITPAMIEDVDKRQWHKFLVTLHFVDDAKSAKLDLLVHVPLEEWVLEMEPHTPNYEEPEEEDEGSDEDEAAFEGAEPDEGEAERVG